jgi:glycosyltransferase involved in cell wall biosynthesis
MISIFTGTHGDSKYLPELWETIKNQTEQDFEWIIVKNNGGVVPFSDPRIKVFETENPKKSIGLVKRFACEKATGDILVEADHDDLLTPICLEEIKKAFLDPKVSFVYSNFCEFYFDHPTLKDWESPRYDPAYGWRYRDYEWQGHKLNECLDFETLPSNFAMIWFAPNHVRAWRTKDYWAVGGHNPDLEAVDDFDLELRTYLYGQFKHIDKCLYLYRINGQNQWIQKNRYIQETARNIADQYMDRIAYRWAELNGLKTINIQDIEGGLDNKWPIEDNSVGIIKAWDRFNLCADPIHIMSEIYRVLIPGGWLLSSTVSTTGNGAWMDPRNKSYWNEYSFEYYIDKTMAPFIENNKIRFQEIRRKTYFPSKWHEDRNIPYVLFNGIALKDGMPRLPGQMKI